MQNDDKLAHEPTIGPMGDTIKVSPPQLEREDHLGKNEHNEVHEVRTDPTKRHGDGLVEGNGSRHGSVDTIRPS